MNLVNLRKAQRVDSRYKCVNFVYDVINMRKTLVDIKMGEES